MSKGTGEQNKDLIKNCYQASSFVSRGAGSPGTLWETVQSTQLRHS